MKDKKSIAKIAIIGASVATLAAVASNILTSKKKKEKTAVSSENTSANDDDFDTIDFEALSNDTPRQYVSIKISEHKPEEV